MLPENIDDLFRDKLDGHATPPGDALWARLQARPEAAADAPSGAGPDVHAAAIAAAETEASRLDGLFRDRLGAHATVPGRAGWERLEDEHLRPRKRRAAAWWPLALAAVVALLLVAGGASLWSGRSVGPGAAGPMASRQSGQLKQSNRAGSGETGAGETVSGEAGGQSVASDATPAPLVTGRREVAAPALAATTAPQAAAGAAATSPSILAANEKNTALRATRSGTLASTAPPANRAGTGQSLNRLAAPNRQPDAAAGQRSQVARTTPDPARPGPSVADELRRATAPASVAVVMPAPTVAPEMVRPEPTPGPTLVASNEVIIVDVRAGGAAAERPARTSISAVAEVAAPERRRSFGGRLLQQAGNLSRGERVSLAEVTGLPENMTLRATVAGHSISKSIRL